MISPGSVSFSHGEDHNVPPAFITTTFCYYYDKVDAPLGITLLARSITNSLPESTKDG